MGYDSDKPDGFGEWEKTGENFTENLWDFPKQERTIMLHDFYESNNTGSRHGAYGYERDGNTGTEFTIKKERIAYPYSVSNDAFNTFPFMVDNHNFCTVESFKMPSINFSRRQSVFSAADAS